MTIDFPPTLLNYPQTSLPIRRDRASIENAPKMHPIERWVGPNVWTSWGRYKSPNFRGRRHFIGRMSLNVEPSAGTFPATGGNATHNIVSLSENRLAFKVKSSNNECYRVRPVYGFLESKATQKLEIVRLAGPPKEDKIVVQWAEVPADEADSQAPFKAGAQQGEVILPVKAE